MGTLFLVRRSMESYHGPYSIEELRRNYKAMEFGLQDEIAGSLGKWITLDNVPSLKRHYPEIAKLVQEDFLGGWAVSEDLEKKLLAEESKAKKKKKSARSKKGRTLKRSVIVLATAAIAIGVVKYHKKIIQLIPSQNSRETATIQGLSESNDLTEFDSYLTSQLPKVIPKIIRSRDAYNEWIPFLRLHAFRHDGRVPGLKAKLLRGMGQVAAPPDCNVDILASKWIEGKTQWQSFASGALFPNQVWTRTLLWDPYWIKRRKMLGWISPSNYYEGCLMMSEKSLDQMNDPELNDVISLFQYRIRAMLAFIRSEDAPIASDPFSPLGYLSCLDGANNLEDLSLCRVKEIESVGFKRFLGSYFAVSESRIILQKTESIISDDNLAKLAKVNKDMKQNEEITKLDYEPELKYLQSLLSNRGSTAEAQKRVKYEFPEVDFSH